MTYSTTTSTASSTVAIPRDQWVNCHSQQEYEAKDFSIDAVANEILLLCFGLLGPEDLEKTRLVCRKWSYLSDVVLEQTDLAKSFPKLTILDGEVWKKHIEMERYGLTVNDTEPLPKRIVVLALARMFADLDGKIENDAGITLLTIPKGLSLIKAEACMRTPIQGQPANIIYTTDAVREQIGSIEVENTHYVAITNGVLNESRGISVKNQTALVQENKCAMPSMISMLALNQLTYVISSVRLYSDTPRTYSRVEDTVDFDWGKLNVVVGGFASAGLTVISHSYCAVIIGVAALRKF